MIVIEKKPYFKFYYIKAIINELFVVHRFFFLDFFLVTDEFSELTDRVELVLDSLDYYFT